MSDELKRAYHQAIRLLSQRDHSRKELADKITRKHEVGESELNGLLDELEASNYLDDRRYAAMFVRSSVMRGHGPMKISYALRDKGVDDDLAREAFESSETDWLEQARYQREKKFGEEIPEDFKERARQSRFLAGRGFYIDTINAVFHEEC
uniref:Regulatory protein RecX n=1 Tax=uncultured Thiotrichaceae bacterium TaxID=298394 RepID=A0A6S6UF74_9GAMM|nr:MAG: Regulatory protein RecX [uncultured Thiotrichaceae bacterium]